MSREHGDHDDIQNALAWAIDCVPRPWWRRAWAWVKRLCLAALSQIKEAR